MMKLAESKMDDLRADLTIDCDQCSGLCCVALYCTKSDGFPENKGAGIPCRHLMPDFRCQIHSLLSTKGMKGCLAYDCYGAGQWVTQKTYAGNDWKKDPEQASEIFAAFLLVFQLHQMAWYLLEAQDLTIDENLRVTIQELLAENRRMTSLQAAAMPDVDVMAYRERVNQVLKQVSESITPGSLMHAGKDFIGKNFKKSNLDGRNFTMTMMVAANLEGCSLKGANFLGADLRDANIKNTDLSQSLFLTQMQVNAARGNSKTKLPAFISRPASWA